MYCPSCGNYNTDSSNFCKKCGMKLTDDHYPIPDLTDDTNNRTNRSDDIAQKQFSSSDNFYTVHNDKRNEEPQGLVHSRSVSLHYKLKQSHKCRDNDNVDRDVDLVRNDGRNQRNHHIRQDKDEHSRESHLKAVHSRGRSCERRTHSEHQHEGRVILYQTVCQKMHLATHRSVLRLKIKPYRPPALPRG